MFVLKFHCNAVNIFCSIGQSSSTNSPILSLGTGQVTAFISVKEVMTWGREAGPFSHFKETMISDVNTDAISVFKAASPAKLLIGELDIDVCLSFFCSGTLFFCCFMFINLITLSLYQHEIWSCGRELIKGSLSFLLFLDRSFSAHPRIELSVLFPLI